MGTFKTLGQAVILGGALTMVVACGSGGHNAGSADPASLPGAAVPARVGECDHLTDGEVTEAIGPNDGGQHDYLLGGCVWRSTTGAKDGLVEKIYVAVLPATDYEVVAQIGQPVSGFGDGATYAPLHGELWFSCRTDKFCGIKADIGNGATRQDVAMRLGKLLQARV